jgi:hypothetical protein
MHVNSIIKHLTTGRLQYPQSHLTNGGFTAAGFPDNGDHLFFVYAQIQVMGGLHRLFITLIKVHVYIFKLYHRRILGFTHYCPSPENDSSLKPDYNYLIPAFFPGRSALRQRLLYNSVSSEIQRESQLQGRRMKFAEGVLVAH